MITSCRAVGAVALTGILSMASLFAQAPPPPTDGLIWYVSPGGQSNPTMSKQANGKSLPGGTVLLDTIKYPGAVPNSGKQGIAFARDAQNNRLPCHFTVSALDASGKVVPGTAVNFQGKIADDGSSCSLFQPGWLIVGDPPTTYSPFPPVLQQFNGFAPGTYQVTANAQVSVSGPFVISPNPFPPAVTRKAVLSGVVIAPQ